MAAELPRMGSVSECAMSFHSRNKYLLTQLFRFCKSISILFPMREAHFPGSGFESLPLNVSSRSPVNIFRPHFPNSIHRARMSSRTEPAPVLPFLAPHSDGGPRAMSVPNYKVVVLGPSNCGKTSLINRYVNAQFSPQTVATTQTAFYRRRLQSFGIDCSLEIWDTAGQERFHALTPMFYRDAQGAAVVFDLTDNRALDATRQWVQELRTARGEHCALVVVGNKADLAEERAGATAADVRRYAEGNAVPYFETSAKTGANVDAAFMGLVKAMRSVKEPAVVPERRARRKESSTRFVEAPDAAEGGCC
jgi:small GTP-binding protein